MTENITVNKKANYIHKCISCSQMETYTHRLHLWNRALSHGGIFLHYLLMLKWCKLPLTHLSCFLYDVLPGITGWSCGSIYGQVRTLRYLTEWVTADRDTWASAHITRQEFITQCYSLFNASFFWHFTSWIIYKAFFIWMWIGWGLCGSLNKKFCWQ